MSTTTLTTAASVLVVDDDPAVLHSVSRLLGSAGYDVRTFSEPEDFLRQELPPGPACVLLDLFMDDVSGLDVQKALLRNERRVPVVFLSGHGTVHDAVACFRQGAEDFLEKPIRPDDLLEAVGRAVESDRRSRADQDARAEALRRFNLLTGREKEVMALVVSGLANKQAAAELGITEKTVKVHRARVVEKMGADSLPHLVVIAGRLSEELASVTDVDKVMAANGLCARANQSVGSQLLR